LQLINAIFLKVQKVSDSKVTFKLIGIGATYDFLCLPLHQCLYFAPFWGHYQSYSTKLKEVT